MSNRHFTAEARDVIMEAYRLAEAEDFRADSAAMSNVQRGTDEGVLEEVFFEGHVPAVDWPHIKAAIESLHPDLGDPA